ncbi:Ssb Single-stranded DNA-binding protein [uncultured Caudovirales phage]|uniref:Single-stranded DNA-binding protein n=1 Tax=uncultured Caudovirales phage TaxID=2100421 RepID=A0A6J5ST99_9CAUD|nr:Ssb Single-stranded DNA-binding protein [uncultured Caudovirales phage]CAB4218535.1 Ssb Single-stranded DNA-binding protein [uncultured Caudovirales phage]
MLNKAQVIGRVGSDIQVRYSSAGEAIVNVSVATSEKWKDKETGEIKEKVEWHKVVAFGKTAEIMGKYVKKGDLIYIDGKMTMKKYEDKVTGAEKFNFEIRVTEMKMLGQKQSAQSEITEVKKEIKQDKREISSQFEDDIPF